MPAPSSMADRIRRWVVAGFVALLTVPAVALALSPATPGAISAILSGAYDKEALKATVRRATPLWQEAGLLYGTALYRLRTSPSPANGVVGKDGFVFLGDTFASAFSQGIHRTALTDEQAETYVSILDLQHRWLAARGIPMLFLVGPSPATIYPDKLPGWARSEYARSPSTMDKIVAAAARKGLQPPFVDVRTALKEARSRADTYSPLDTHWTDFGGWVAWRELAGQLAHVLVDFHAFGTDALDDVTINPNQPNGFAAILGIGSNNTWTSYKLTTPFPAMEFLKNGTWTSRWSGAQTGLQDLPRLTRTASAPTGKRALIVRDSMANALSPFFQATFAETDQVAFTLSPDGATFFADDELRHFVDEVGRFKPDVVIFVITERSLIIPLGAEEHWRAALR